MSRPKSTGGKTSTKVKEDTKKPKVKPLQKAQALATTKPGKAAKEDTKNPKDAKDAKPEPKGKPILSEIRSDNLSAELQRLKKEFKGYKDLYYRRMVEIQRSDKSKISFTLMQFNVLADGLSGVFTFDGKPDPKAFIKSPQPALYWNYRGFRIVEEIVRNRPDIVTMEECDRFKFIEFYLKKFSYVGYHRIKPDSPCLKVGKKSGYALPPDGVAIFYKSDKFRELQVHRYGPDVEKDPVVNICGMIIHLQAKKNPNKSMLVMAGHFKSAKDHVGETKRLLQLQHLFSNAKRIQDRLEKQHKRHIPIFCGCDLNAPPKDTKGFPPYAYRSIIHGEKFNTLAQKQLKEGKIAEDEPKVPQGYTPGYGLRFSSAYRDAQLVGKPRGIEPKYSTWKARVNTVDQHTIDYIFYQKDKGAALTRALSIPLPKEVNQKTFLPGWEYPSDHFAIMAAFTF